MKKLTFFIVLLWSCIEADEVADYIKPMFHTYQMLQESYFEDVGMLGTFEQIGFKPVQMSYGVSLENKDSPTSHNYILTSTMAVGNCPRGTRWEVRSVITEGKICYEALVSEKQRCGSVDTFCELATSGKCGYDCSEKDVVCPKGTEYNEIYELCSPVCPIGMYRPWWDPDGGSSYEPQKCVNIPKNAHKVKKNGVFYKGGSAYADYSPNEWAWECNKDYSRYSGNKCLNLPKGAMQSNMCWIYSINLVDLKKVIPDAEYVYIPDGLFDPGVDLKDTLNVVDFFRGPIGEDPVFVAIGKKVSCKRSKVFVNVNTETTSLGPYSGCWECPNGTIYDEDKNECVTGRDSFRKNSSCRIIGNYTEE